MHTKHVNCLAQGLIISKHNKCLVLFPIILIIIGAVIQIDLLTLYIGIFCLRKEIRLKTYSWFFEKINKIGSFKMAEE